MRVARASYLLQNTAVDLTGRFWRAIFLFSLNFIPCWSFGVVVLGIALRERKKLVSSSICRRTYDSLGCTPGSCKSGVQAHSLLRSILPPALPCEINLWPSVRGYRNHKLTGRANINISSLNMDCHLTWDTYRPYKYRSSSSSSCGRRGHVDSLSLSLQAPVYW